MYDDNMIINESLAKKAAQHLKKYDRQLASVIEIAGPCPQRPHKNYYQELVEAIVSQQLSVKASATILKRFRDLFGGEFPSPQQILSKDVETFRGVGFSRGKATYVRDLAQHIIDGKVKFDSLDNLSNQEIIDKLTAVKGIGEWTAHMFLMFCMGRTDVLAHGDLGIKNGIQKLYRLDHQPNAQEVIEIAEKHHWHPYESVACWYIWHSLDNKPAIT